MHTKLEKGELEISSREESSEIIRVEVGSDGEEGTQSAVHGAGYMVHSTLQLPLDEIEDGLGPVGPP